MAGWLSRATEAFRQQPPSAPELYEVGCDCGGRVTGERSHGVQRPPCPSCGHLIFVLPANVYPRLAKPATKTAPPKPSAVKQPVAPATASRSPAKIKTRAKEAEDASRVERSGIALEANEKLLTPFRLTMTAMLVVASLTAWGLWHRQRIELAKSIVAKATAAGLLALKERDFSTAARELEQARDAVNLLKRTDEESQLVRCLCREAIAARGLAHDSLFALLHTSLADIKPGSADHKLKDKHKPEDLSSKTFNDLYRGSWVLFDAVVIVPDDDSQPYTLDMPVFHLGQAIRIEANFAALRQAARQAPANEPVRVIFAAQLERLAPQAGPQSEAVLTLKGQSAFLWTSHDTYAALGYHEDDAEELKVTHAILDHQLEVMKELK